MKYLKGCAIGCGALLLLGTVSCVGFVMWMNGAGELLEPERLVTADTTGYAAWTLSLDDPGTRQLVDELLNVLERTRGKAKSPLPPVLDGWLNNLQQSRDERKIRELFPMAVGWTMRPSGAEATDLHLLSVSIEKLGNRGVLADLILAFIFKRTPDADVIVHHNERVYELKDGGAFFVDGATVVIAGDLENACAAVERLKPTDTISASSGEIRNMLDEIRNQGALRCAITNSDGALDRVIRDLSGLDGLHELWEWPSSRISRATFAGGFTTESAFRATLSLSSSEGSWSPESVEEITSLLRSMLGDSSAGVDITSQAVGNQLNLFFEIDDLPGQVEARLDELIKSID